MESQNQLDGSTNKTAFEQSVSKNKESKEKHILLWIVLSLIALFILSYWAIYTVIFKNIATQYQKIDSQFKEYILSNYDIKVNEDGYVKECFSNCDYFGFYNVGKDYNYIIQIKKTGDSFDISIDKEAMELRKKLYEYIIEVRGSDIAPNYLGYYKNTMSGHVRFSSGELGELYYIVKYNDRMNLEDELRKDYLILQKAQELASDKAIVQSMTVLYIADKKLDDDDWVKNTGLNVGDSNRIIYNSSDYLNNYKYRYSIYQHDRNSLASMSIDDFLTLVKEKMATN